MEFLKRFWVAVVGVVGAVIGLLLLKKGHDEKVQAQSDLEHANADKTDAVLAERQENVEEKIKEVEKQAEVEKQKKLTHEQTAEELKNL